MHAKEIATEVIKKLVHSGYKAYFAGGWVRDYLMGHPSDDIDIATDAPPQEILDLFPNTILVGLAFGVVIVVLHGHQFEVSTFRRDIEYLNGRKPESIELSTPEEDAIRRDFTINGMFYDPLEDKIYDFVQGMEDLKKGIIRTIGDPFERFLEDRLRMIRAIRFSARFGFPIDLDTQQAIQENAETLFPAVAIERVWNEFTKMSKYTRFEQAIIDMHRLGLLAVIFPQLRHVHLHDIKHYVSVFPNFPQNTPTIVYLAELFPHFNANDLYDLCIYLRTSMQDAKLIAFVREGMKLFAQPSEVSDAEWVRFFAHPLATLTLDVFAAHHDPEQKKDFYLSQMQTKERLKNHIQRLINKTPLINSAILKSAGIPQGKIMGILLKKAEELAIEHDLNESTSLLNLLQKSELWPQA